MLMPRKLDNARHEWQGLSKIFVCKSLKDRLASLQVNDMSFSLQEMRQLIVVFKNEFQRTPRNCLRCYSWWLSACLLPHAINMFLAGISCMGGICPSAESGLRLITPADVHFWTKHFWTKSVSIIAKYLRQDPLARANVSSIQ